MSNVHCSATEGELPHSVDSVGAPQAYVDASTKDHVWHTSLVCSAVPDVRQTCPYITEAPFASVTAELVAIRDSLSTIGDRLCTAQPTRRLLYTDSTAAVLARRRVASSLDIVGDVCHLVQSFLCSVRVVRAQRTTPHLSEAARQCASCTRYDTSSSSPAWLRPLQGKGL